MVHIHFSQSLLYSLFSFLDYEMELVLFFAKFEKLKPPKSFNQTGYIFLSSWVVRNYFKNLTYIQLVDFLACPENWFRTVKTYAVKFPVRFNLVTQLL
jgi:hypothetical protein